MNSPTLQELFQNQIIPVADFVRNVSAKDFAYAVLREAVLNLWLEPGMRITEKSMAQALGISPTPVREAFIRLVQENMLLALPQRGTYVAKIDIQTVRNASYVRRTLERDSLNHLEFPVPRNIEEEIKTNLQEQEKWLEKHRGAESPAEFLKLDYHFHKLLFASANLTFVSDIIKQFSLHNHRIYILCFRFIPDWRILSTHHKGIAEGIFGRNREQVLEEWERHYSTIEKNMDRAQREFPEYFSL